MKAERALEIIARHALTEAAEDLHNDWDVYPEIGEHDWQEICRVAGELAGRPSPEEFQEAYRVLEARASDGEPTPDIGDGQPEEPPYVVWTDEHGTEQRVHWKEPTVWQHLYFAVVDERTYTAERIWDQLPREGRRMHLPGLWGQPETRAWLQERGVDIEMRWEGEEGEDE